jgi:hypothetical protein
MGPVQAQALKKWIQVPEAVVVDKVVAPGA